MAEQLVVGIAATVDQSEGEVDGAIKRCTIEPNRGGHGSKREVFETIPVRVEHRGNVFERRAIFGLQRNANAPEPDDERLVCGVGLPCRDGRAPPLLERQRGLNVVEHRDPRWNGHFDRVLRQDALCKGVHGRDGGAVEFGQRFGAAQGDHSIVTRCAVLERATNAIAQLGRSRLGERDGRDVAQCDLFVRDQTDDTPYQRRRLAGAGTRLDKKCLANARADDAVAGRLIDRHESAHDTPAVSVTYAARAPSAASWPAVFSAHDRARPRGHTRS